MNRKSNSLLLLAAAGALIAPGCKVQPVAENTIPGEEHADHVREAGGMSPGAPVDVGPNLGAAAREALKYLPMGAAGPFFKPGIAPGDAHKDEIPVVDRWRIGFPAWERGSQSDSPWDKGAWWDPYHQNWLKGDYPLPGTQNTFLNLEAQSISLVERRTLPIPSGVFPRAGGAPGFFSTDEQMTLSETVFLTADLFHGETSFKPVDWRVFVRGAFNWNYTSVDQNQALYADPARGDTRYDNHAALQQAFFETTLADVSRKYDVVQMRIGTQLFNSDFKGFMFFDEAPGVRLFGNADDNLWQWNLAYFKRWDKDTNSGLNTFDSIKQDIFLVNLYRQDVLGMLMPRWQSRDWSHGLQTQLSLLYFNDDDSVHYDENDFLVRPRAVGVPAPNARSIVYAGWSNEGHVGRLNITSALYTARGHEDFNEIAGKRTDVRGEFGALELSVDVDWMRFRVQGMYQSGDDDPLDGKAGGFDAIYDNPVFAGGDFSFWQRNGVRLTGSGVGLNQRLSFLNTLRSSKDQGAPSFVNPGLILVGAGYDAQLTPHLKLISNLSYLRFDNTGSLEYVLNQDSLDDEIGYDLSLGVVWRPLLTDNVIVRSGVSTLFPGEGFRDIYTAATLYTYFAELILTW